MSIWKPHGWTLHGDGTHVQPGAVVKPEERLAWPLTIGIGMQHVVAMFGATFLVPLMTGFPPATTLFFSAIGTVTFLLLTANRLPSYLGSSFAFIAPIQAATTSGGMGAALGGVFIAGALLAGVGALAHFAGTRWIDALMPPIVTGTIVALIGFNLAPAAWGNVEQAPITAIITLTAIILITVLFRGIIGRLSILLGVAVGYIAAVWRDEVGFRDVRGAAWIGLAEVTAAGFELAGMGSVMALV